MAVPQIPDITPDNHHRVLEVMKEIIDTRSNLSSRGGTDRWVTLEELQDNVLESAKSDIRVRAYFHDLFEL
jgi:hypothetical protein